MSLSVRPSQITANLLFRSAEKIAAYMGGCPVINVPGRTFPVTARYLEDVVELTRYRLDPNSDSPYVARSMRSAFSLSSLECY